MKKGRIPALTNQEQVLPTTYVRLAQLESTGLPTGSLARGALRVQTPALPKTRVTLLNKMGRGRFPGGLVYLSRMMLLNGLHNGLRAAVLLTSELYIK